MVGASVYLWHIKGTLSENLTPNVIWGFMGLVCVDILFFLSLQIIRKLLYPLFYSSHVLAAIIILPAVSTFTSPMFPHRN